jgi:hypothetical protein
LETSRARVRSTEFPNTGVISNPHTAALFSEHESIRRRMKKSAKKSWWSKTFTAWRYSVTVFSYESIIAHVIKM